MNASTTLLVAQKKSLRALMASRIQSLTPSALQQESLACTRCFFTRFSVMLDRFQIVCAYLSMPQHEFETHALIHGLFQREKRVFVPRMLNGSEMTQLELKSEQEMHELPAKKWGIREPAVEDGRCDIFQWAQQQQSNHAIHHLESISASTSSNSTSSKAPLSSPPAPSPSSPSSPPVLVIVPGVAFTADGLRLGHGRGYYDRFLTKLKQHCNVTTVALALNCQIVNELPVTENDVRIDHIFAESLINA